MGILIQGGRIVDAATDTDKKGDIYLEDGVITDIGDKLEVKDKSDRVIDAKGCLVMPGLIDLHVCRTGSIVCCVTLINSCCMHQDFGVITPKHLAE